MTKKLTSREKLLRGLKRGGYDVEKSHQYWTDMSKKLEAQKKEYEKQHSNKSNMNEEAPVHNEFKKSMGVGSYGDFAKRHGIQKTKTVISSLKKERDEIRKKEWAGPQHIKHHDFAIHGLQRAIGEDVSMVGGSPANNVGGGDIAGLGVGPQGEPGVKLRNKKKVVPFAIFARKMPSK
jgi:ribosomal protein L9